jgi:hypothetical protein
MHLAKEARLKERGIKVYNCVIANMIHDQLIEKLGYETTYVASIDVDEKSGTCQLQCAIYETPAKIGCVSDWAEEMKRIEENSAWRTIRS